MLRTLSAIIFTAIVSLAATPVMAQEGSFGTHEGQFEVNFSINRDDTTIDQDGEDLLLGQVEIDLLVGYFVTDSIEVGASLAYDCDSVEWQGATVETSSLYPYIFASYNHNLDGNITPFIGAGVGSGSFENERGDTIDSVYYGPFVGARYFLEDWAAITAQATYDIATFDYPNGESYDATNLDLRLGLSVFFN